MKRAAAPVLAACLTLWAVAAMAFELTQPLPPCVDRAEALPAPVAARPIGLPPVLDGRCRWVLPEVNAVGAAAAWWCERENKPPLLIPYAVEWAAVTPEMRDDFVALMWPGDRAARMQAMQAKYGTKHFLDMCNVWGPMRERINAARPADPVPATWVVAPVSTGQRPSYLLTGEALTRESGKFLPTMTAGKPTACTCDGPGNTATLNGLKYCAAQGYQTAAGAARLVYCVAAPKP